MVKFSSFILVLITLLTVSFVSGQEVTTKKDADITTCFQGQNQDRLKCIGDILQSVTQTAPDSAFNNMLLYYMTAKNNILKNISGGGGSVGVSTSVAPAPMPQAAPSPPPALPPAAPAPSITPTAPGTQQGAPPPKAPTTGPYF